MLLNEKALALSVSVSLEAEKPWPSPKCLETCLRRWGGRGDDDTTLHICQKHSRKAAAAIPRLALFSQRSSDKVNRETTSMR